MKKILALVLSAFLFAETAKAQAPQFAVVRPDGTSFICPSFDSAHSKALDNDFIYLPGTTIAGNKTITKQLTIIGTGHYPDSTVYTGKTVFTGNITLEKKCHLEGFDVQNIIVSGAAAANSSFVRLRSGSIYLGGTNDHFIDGCAVTVISADVFQTNTCIYSSNLFIRNSFLQYIEKLQFTNFSNCLFLGANGNYLYHRVANTIYSDCIFRGMFAVDWVFQTACFPLIGNSSNNCIWTNNITVPGSNNYMTSQPDTLMVNSGITGEFFNYSYNYHLRPGSPFLTAGSDGSPIGIYGGSAPYREGAVPGNPHIYYKQVSTQTNANGQLQIQFRVRTGNQ